MPMYMGPVIPLALTHGETGMWASCLPALLACMSSEDCPAG